MYSLWLFARIKHQNTDANADEHGIKYTPSKLWPRRPTQASLAMLLGCQAQIIQVRPPKCSNDVLNMQIQLCGINSIMWWGTGEDCWHRVCVAIIKAYHQKRFLLHCAEANRKNQTTTSTFRKFHGRHLQPPGLCGYQINFSKKKKKKKA